MGKVIVSDLDSALDMAVRGAWSMHPITEFRDVRFGKIRWRAPEMQTGQDIGLFSAVFAYALVSHLSLVSIAEGWRGAKDSLADSNIFQYIYTLIGQVPLGEDNYDELAEQVGLLPEELVLGRTIEHFGPVPPEFLKHTADEKWQRR